MSREKVWTVDYTRRVEFTTEKKARAFYAKQVQKPDLVTAGVRHLIEGTAVDLVMKLSAAIAEHPTIEKAWKKLSIDEQTKIRKVQLKEAKRLLKEMKWPRL